MNTLKKYASHIINISFVLSLMMILLLKDSAWVMFFCLTSVILFMVYIGEIFYYIGYARDNDLIDNPFVTYPLMILFGLFYLPCFSMNKVYNDENKKIINTVYSAVIGVLLVILIVLFTLNRADRNALKKEVINPEKDISFRIPDNYVEKESSSADYIYSNGKTYVSIDIIRRYVDPKASLEYTKEDLSRTDDDIKIIDKSNKDDGYKLTDQYVMEGTYDGNTFVYVFTVISSKDTSKPIIKVTQSCLKKDYANNKTQFKKMIDSFKYL